MKTLHLFFSGSLKSMIAITNPQSKIPLFPTLTRGDQATNRVPAAQYLFQRP